MKEKENPVIIPEVILPTPAQRKNPAGQPQKEQSISAYLLFGLALLYTISPIDFVPDFIPVGGWIEDASFLVATGLNLLEKNFLETNGFLQRIVHFIKWGFIGIGIAFAVIIGLLIVLVWKVAF